MVSMVTMEIIFLAFTERKSKPVLLAIGPPDGSSMMHGIYACFALGIQYMAFSLGLWVKSHPFQVSRVDLC
jgi:hypothetical protein